jgi:hypothetical protein
VFYKILTGSKEGGKGEEVLNAGKNIKKIKHTRLVLYVCS